MKSQINQKPNENNQQLEQLLTNPPQLSQQHRQKNLKLPLQMYEQGRKLLLQKNYFQASKSLAKSVMAFQYLLKNNQLSLEQTKQMFTKIMIPVYSNLALCHLKMQSYQSVVSFCNQILGNDISNVKARYRRGVAYQKLKKYQEAIEDFKQAGNIDQEIRSQCERLVKQCRNSIIKQKNKEKKMANAFISDIQDSRSKENSGLNINTHNGDSKLLGNHPGKIKQFINWICQLCKKKQIKNQ